MRRAIGSRPAENQRKIFFQNRGTNGTNGCPGHPYVPYDRVQMGQMGPERGAYGPPKKGHMALRKRVCRRAIGPICYRSGGQMGQIALRKMSNGLRESHMTPCKWVSQRFGGSYVPDKWVKWVSQQGHMALQEAICPYDKMSNGSGKWIGGGGDPFVLALYSPSPSRFR